MGAEKLQKTSGDLSREEQGLTRVRRKNLGAFFTPADQADFMVRTYQIHRDWADGAVILDPTAGNGALLESLIRTTLNEEIPITEKMLSSLGGIELEPAFFRDFTERIRSRYRLRLPEYTIRQGDILDDQASCKADILFGNPPWLNFTDMEESQKEKAKPLFLHYGLAGAPGELLLGNSRIDLAALVMMKTLSENLHPRGKAYFFTPLSVILNEGAHNRFRKGSLGKRDFRIREIRDFNGQEIFQDVSTRCGFLSIETDRKPEAPIPYYTLENSRWEKQWARPISSPGSAYIVETDRSEIPREIPRIQIEKSSQPRQGINTGGRNSFYIFSSCLPLKPGIVRVGNREGTVDLPEELIYPLIGRNQFKETPVPDKFIFLPYSDEGRILSREELAAYPLAFAYVERNRELLESRKGILMQSRMKNGTYWGLLGIGPYTFAPWKIVWESYGKKDFLPRMFSRYREKPWIPNQALQAYCSFQKKEDALKILEELQNPLINSLLQKQRMQGTCNWAQPGRIKVFMDIA